MMSHSGASKSDVVIDLISDDEDFDGGGIQVSPKPISSKIEQRKEIKEESLSRLEAGITLVNDTADGTRVPNGKQNAVLHSTVGKAQVQVSRCFWKAGDYELQTSSSSSTKRFHNGMDHVRVHPKFLHSNATSHKWALGAIAELLDNAVDEIRNGATFVSVDKIANPRDNSPCILIQDDGGGMDPDCLRQCMSLGYSRKTTKNSIGQYGNGFKTSTMRLGADAIVFSRCALGSCVTQSVGLLSYTFLRGTGQEDVVVPMVDFEVSPTDGKPNVLLRGSHNDWLNNLSTILEWSPFLTESDLLKQFDDIGRHGTKIILYNLWMNDDGELELDFQADKEDIQLRGAPKINGSDSLQKQLTYQHVATCLRFSLRAYASILYLQIPPTFQIILRGKVVEHKSISEDLKFKERILYKPQVGNSREREVSVITTIGFAKEAPMVNVHGFNIYHKNRLIMPFWKVFNEGSSRGKGVVGILEANFIEPAHDKQDFEKTPMLQRLETRLKHMTIEYWNLHCELIGYQPPRSKQLRPPTTTPIPPGTNQMESSYPHTQAPPAASAGSLSAGGDADVAVDVKPSCIPPRCLPSERNGASLSAPSTPPQLGSDVTVPSSKPSSNVDEKSDELKSEQGEDGDDVNHNGIPLKRAAAQSSSGPSKRREIVLAVPAPVYLGAMEGMPSPAMDAVSEEVRLLRLRCLRYEETEKELKMKVSELENELSKYKKLASQQKQLELKQPKEEL